MCHIFFISTLEQKDRNSLAEKNCPDSKLSKFCTIYLKLYCFIHQKMCLMEDFNTCTVMLLYCKKKKMVLNILHTYVFMLTNQSSLFYVLEKTLGFESYIKQNFKNLDIYFSILILLI